MKENCSKTGSPKIVHQEFYIIYLHLKNGRQTKLQNSKKKIFLNELSSHYGIYIIRTEHFQKDLILVDCFKSFHNALFFFLATSNAF